MRRILAAVVASAALASGAAVSAAISSAPALAQESQDEGTPSPDEGTTSPSQTPATPQDRTHDCGISLAGLVEDGTLTQAQADAIGDAVRAARASGDFPRGDDKAAALREILAPLVRAGTITQDQADAVVAAKQTRRSGARWDPSSTPAATTV